MFLVTQLIGLYVVNFYMSDGIKLPYGFDENPQIEKEQSFQKSLLTSIVISFALAIAIVFLLMRTKLVWLLRGWFFVVMSLALGITISVLLKQLNIINATFFALCIGVVLAYIKVFQKSILVHNLTELLIYPGIAAIFVAMLNIWSTIILLIIISVYDIWAVWHSGIMQKMAKFQINSVGVFSGFFIPYASKKIKDKIKLLKLKYQNSKIPESVIKKNKIKVSLAILGGGDVIFPIIAAGVVLTTFHSFIASLIVILGATLALLYLFIFAEKKKFYPAMPYITTGIFAAMLLVWLLRSLMII
jgi:presenilin-like A22 family membrane protease